MKLSFSTLPRGQDLRREKAKRTDIYFSVDVETDGPIPGRFSMLSFALTYAGTFDGRIFSKPRSYTKSFYAELKPTGQFYDEETLQVSGLNRDRLVAEGQEPAIAMTEAANWVKSQSPDGTPVCVAYPLSFDWSWLYWYFVEFSAVGSPFGFSSCFDLKTAVSLVTGAPVALSGRSRLPADLASRLPHTHNALDDAIEQAIIFANVFESVQRGL